MPWSPQQEKALTAIGHWRGASKPCDDNVFRLFGYAGTGKTELAAEIGHIRAGTHYAAFTGKAAHVLRQRGCEPVSTIHRLIYKTTYDPDSGKYFRTLKSEEELWDVKLLVVDECSMVNAELGRDLASFSFPIIAFGDPEQLPPVNGLGFFMHDEPDVMLTEIHRQARESPIIRLADNIRRGERLPKRGYRDDGVIVTDPCIDNPEHFGVVLVGTNATRYRWNSQLRRKHGFRNEVPARGETVVCLRNDYQVDAPVYNGSQWEVRASQETTHDDTAVVDLVLDSQYNGSSRVLVPRASFRGGESPLPYSGLQHFDFGYALTVHKAQGSEWNDVLMIDEGRAFPGEARRWRYTAITRAREQLTIVV